MVDLSSEEDLQKKFRFDYAKLQLLEKDLSDSPFDQFNDWFEAYVALNPSAPNAMTLSTVSEQGQPSSRVVLLSRFSKKGFVFFSHYLSQKGQDLSVNSRACLQFFFVQQERCIYVKGDVSKLSRKESLTYFRSRPRDSQISALLSKQSQSVSHRDCLDSEFIFYKNKYEGKPIPLPKNWGGYCLRPIFFEFWQGRVSRLHDRLCYVQDKKGAWKINRLYP
ncbi:MAG: pyridoxamine 5'-phosphate oxidase [bacterium]